MTPSSGDTNSEDRSAPGSLAAQPATLEKEKPVYQRQAIVQRELYKVFEPVIIDVFEITNYDDDGITMENLETVINRFYDDQKVIDFKEIVERGTGAPEKNIIDAIHTIQRDMCKYFLGKLNDPKHKEIREQRGNKSKFTLLTQTLQVKIDFFIRLLTPPPVGRGRTYRNKRRKRYQSIKISSKRHSLS